MLELESIDNTSEVLEYRASLINNQWFGTRNNKTYPFKYPKDICNTLRYIYSSPTNDYWSTHLKVGTCRRHDKLNVLNYQDFDMWTPFREGLQVNCVLIGEMLEVNWKLHQIKAKEDAKRDSKSIRRES